MRFKFFYKCFSICLIYRCAFVNQVWNVKINIYRRFVSRQRNVFSSIGVVLNVVNKLKREFK